jgi:hypothetical protein
MIEAASQGVNFAFGVHLFRVRRSVSMRYPVKVRSSVSIVLGLHLQVPQAMCGFPAPEAGGSSDGTLDWNPVLIVASPCSAKNRHNYL